MAARTMLVMGLYTKKGGRRDLTMNSSGAEGVSQEMTRKEIHVFMDS